MDDAFTRAIADWAAFSTYTGSAAATLLGLLFVAASLRLGIFRDPHLADVGDFAAFTGAAFVVALVLSGVLLVPDQQPLGVGVPVVVLGLGGLVGLGLVLRRWLQLNPRTGPLRPGLDPREGWAWVYLGAWAVPYLGLLIVGSVLTTGATGVLVVLALLDGLLLVLAIASAWLLLTRAQPTSDSDAGSV
jgi:hypothetical protein